MPGIELLQQTGNVKTAYNLTPEQLEQEIATADALIIRSATQARKAIPSPSLSMHLLTRLHTAILRCVNLCSAWKGAVAAVTQITGFKATGHQKLSMQRQHRRLGGMCGQPMCGQSMGNAASVSDRMRVVLMKSQVDLPLRLM